MIVPDLLDDLLAVASPADLLNAAAEIVAGEFPTPGGSPGPCANCGHSFSGSNGHRYEGEVRAGRCGGNGLDPCTVRCQRYVRSRPHLSRDLDRLAHQLRTPAPTSTEETP